MGWIWLIAIVVVCAGGVWASQRPDFWVGVSDILLRKLFKFLPKMFVNRPKTYLEWWEWRTINNTKPSERSAYQKDRLKYLDKLNRDYK